MFEIVLFSLVIVCGLVILACRHVFRAVPVGGGEAIYLSEHEQEPWYLDYARSFFPVLLIVFLLRGFIAEPFRIPSGSMLPTLEVGDFILVNKYKYGLRLPILHKKILSVGSPKRGDIMVFRYPRDNETNYIKRVIGIPGDKVVYRGHKLYVNDVLVEAAPDGSYTPFAKNGRPRSLSKLNQSLIRDDGDETTSFSILHENRSSSPNVAKVVPAGHYLVFGDNRDHSLDSRFWGFVPEQNIVGKAFFIWFHWNTNSGGGVKLSRVGEDI